MFFWINHTPHPDIWDNPQHPIYDILTSQGSFCSLSSTWGCKPLDYLPSYLSEGRWHPSNSACLWIPEPESAFRDSLLSYGLSWRVWAWLHMQALHRIRYKSSETSNFIGSPVGSLLLTVTPHASLVSPCSLKIILSCICCVGFQVLKALILEGGLGILFSDSLTFLKISWRLLSFSPGKCTYREHLVCSLRGHRTPEAHPRSPGEELCSRPAPGGHGAPRKLTNAARCILF